MGSDGTNMLVAQSDRWTQKPDKLRAINHTIYIAGEDILPSAIIRPFRGLYGTSPKQRAKYATSSISLSVYLTSGRPWQVKYQEKGIIFDCTWRSGNAKGSPAATGLSDISVVGIVMSGYQVRYS
ncbi:hypothetical protein BDV33DRAFT_195860 [Aspergillus novoparasiticus]|uniref:Uncharacterized protein n=1 Tax=Aspergillus novoparasiticus TaxID=986946 RepID=A0A5N6EBI8_9EURO|nr:hypothetical protein BDV33DRAFT_195860 [Aspergillus novoparasiticus]